MPAPLDFYFTFTSSVCNVIDEYGLTPQLVINKVPTNSTVKIVATVTWGMGCTKVTFSLVRVSNSTSKISWIYLNKNDH
jgi:hypothetical protein